MSAFVSNSGTVAVLIPIVLGIAASSQIKPIKLLMPLVLGQQSVLIFLLSVRRKSDC